jgi:WD40 repeat protein
MIRPSAVWIYLAFAVPWTTASLAQQPEAAPGRSRRATALVVVEAAPGRVHGTAVGVVRAGLFATNAHTVVGAHDRSAVRLVLDPGETTERIVAAQLVQLDEAVDLALLEADIRPAPEPVEIAAAEGLQPGLRVTRLRFGAPGAASHGYPRASSKEDRVVSLPRDEDGRMRIQLDAPLGTQATEGAFFDEQGRMVGIAVRTQGPNHGFILPAFHIAERIQGVSIVFDPPPLESGDLARPRPWTVWLRRAGPGSFPRDLSVSLTLSAGADDRRMYPAAPLGEGQFRATVVPLPPGVDRRAVLITGRSDGLFGIVDDLTIRIGDRPLRLSELAYVENEPEGRAIATDGRVFKGRAAGLEAIRFTDPHNNAHVVASSQVASFMVRPAAVVSPIAAIEAEVEVRRREEVLSRIKRAIVVNPAAGDSGVRLKIAPLPQPSEALEELLDTGGWLDLKGPGGRNSSPSIRPPAVEIGEAQVSGLQMILADVDAVRGSPIRQASFSPDGQSYVTAGRDGVIGLANSQEGVFLELGKHRGAAQGAAFSADGRYVLSGADDGFLQLWELNDPRTGMRSARFQRPVESCDLGGALSSFAFARVGPLALAASVDGTVRLWRLPGLHQELRRFQGHAGPVLSLAFLPDGRRAVTAGQDGSVRLRDVGDGRELKRFDGHGGAARCVAAAPDGRTVLAGYDDGAARLWDVETGQLVWTMAAHGDRVESVAFSPSGVLAASGGGPKDPTVILRDVAAGREVRRLGGHDGAVRSVAFSPDGLRVLSAGEDGRVRIRQLLDDLPGIDAGEPLVRDLDGIIREVVPGGGGRYLLLTLDGPRRLAVFDVSSAGVAGTIPLPDEDVCVATGASSFFVGFAGSGLVQEWDLATVARRKEWRLPIRGRLGALGIGSDSQGPLFAAWVPGIAQGDGGIRLYFSLIDPETGKVLRVRSHHDREYAAPNATPEALPLELPAPSGCLSVSWTGGIRGIPTRLRPTTDGRLFVVQSAMPGNIPHRFTAIELERDQVRSILQRVTSGLVVPSADGESLFTAQYGVLNRDGQAPDPRQVVQPRDQSRVLIPSADPRYHLEIHGRLDTARRVGSVVDVAIKDRSGTPLATVSRLDEMSDLPWDARTGPADPLFDRRFLLIPSARLLITIPPAQGRLVLRRIDLEEILQRPLRALRGEKLPGLRSKPAGLATSASDGGNTRDRDRLADILRSCWVARTTLLGVLAALSYLAVVAHRLLGSRGRKERTSRVRKGRRWIGWLLLSAAYIITFACVYVEWEAFSTASGAARALDARFAEADREVVNRRELESLIGRAPDRSALAKDGSIVAHYEWKGVLRHYTLRVEYIQGDSGKEVVVNHRFE